MKREDLFEAIGGLDESLLDENVTQLPKRKHYGWIAAIAACLAVCVGAVCLPKLLSGRDGLLPNPPSEEVTPLGMLLGADGTIMSGISYRVLPEDAAPTDSYGMSDDVRELIKFTFDEESATYHLENYRYDPFFEETGTYTIEDDVLTAVSEEHSYTFELLDGYAIRLTEISDPMKNSCRSAVGCVFTTRYFPYEPFATLSEESIEQVTVSTSMGIEFALTDEEAAELAECLQGVVLYELDEEVPYDAPLSDDFLHFNIHQGNDLYTDFYLHKFFWLDGRQYLPEVSTLEKLGALSARISARLRENAEQYQAEQINYQGGIVYYALPEDAAVGDTCTSQFGDGELRFSFHFENNTYRVTNFYSSKTPETGALIKEDGCLLLQSGGVTTHRFEILDDYTLRLTETTDVMNERFIGRLFTSRYLADTPFKNLQPEDIKSITGLSYDSWPFSLTAEEIAQVLPCLQPITLYTLEEDVEYEALEGGCTPNFKVTTKDGGVYDLSCSRFFRMNGVQYLPEEDTLADMKRIYQSIADAVRSAHMDDTDAQTLLAQMGEAEFDHVTLQNLSIPYSTITLQSEQLERFAALCSEQKLVAQITEGVPSDNAMRFKAVTADGSVTQITVLEQYIIIDGQTYSAQAEHCDALYRFGADLVGIKKLYKTPDEFSALTPEDISRVSVTCYQSDRAYLTETQTETFLRLLQEITFYGESASQEVRLGMSVCFDVTFSDGTTASISPDGTLTVVNGVYYDTSDGGVLDSFAHNVLQTVYAETTHAVVPPSEEWLNQVYFGSEFPYFIYGNEDYCVFTEGMSGLFVFDFNAGKITFSANIEETLDNAGVAHGAEGWNGIGFSAYREDGEVKLLCTADQYLPDGTSVQRGFTVDTENGTLNEIKTFGLKIIDCIDYTYNSPYDGFDFLFGAAPIPLDDGYICFENSGLNSDVLPGEGSHLAMIELRKVKGDVVEAWVPFAELALTTRCGLDSIVTE